MDVDVARLQRRTAVGEVDGEYDIDDQPSAGGEQFFKLYMSRLKFCRRSLLALGKERYPDIPQLDQLNDVHTHKGGEVYLVGTIFKMMKNKPAALHEFIGQKPVTDLKPGCFISDCDQLILEDNHSRLTLRLPEGQDIHSFHTGMIVAAVGTQQRDYTMKVREIIYPGIAPTMPLPDPKPSGMVAIVSGLDFGNPANGLSMQMLNEYLTGYLGGDDDVTQSSKILHLIVAGNIIHPHDPDRMDEVDLIMRNRRTRTLHREAMHKTLTSIDEWLMGLCSSMDVTVMPGPNDPSNYSLPQQPYPACLLPVVSKMAKYHAVTNPHRVRVEGVDLLGISGQNVADQRLYSRVTGTLDLMEGHLRCRNICPTAPDTIACFPVAKGVVDPFMLRRSPHVYFVANQDKFETRLTDGPHKIRMVAVPSFSKTQEVVLLDLATLECTSMAFQVSA